MEDKKFVKCPECRGRGENLTGKLYPSGYTEVWEECEYCYGDGQFEEEDYLMMKLAGEI